MTFTLCLADQRTEEWRAARCGRLTGSRAGDMLASIKSGEAAARRDYRMQLVCERLTGEPQDDVFVNAAMQWGVDHESAAFAAYEALTGEVVLRSGFLTCDDLLAGCSLDGHLTNFAGIVELKCPKSSTHLRYLKDGVVPKEHMPQITHNLWITGAGFCDFLSYDPRFPQNLQTFLVRVERADVDLKDYETKALAFLAEVERDYQAIRTMADLPSVLKECVNAV